MLTTGIAMSLGAEQAGVLLGAAVAGDGKSMSFAKCFGDVAGAASGVKGTMPAGQLLLNVPEEAVVPAAKSIGEVAAGTTALPVKLPVGQVLGDNKSIQTSALTASSVATNSEVAAVVPAEAQEKTTKVPVKAVVGGASAGEGRTVAIASQPADDLKDVCTDLQTGSVGQVEGGAEDKAPVQEASQETGEAKVAPMPYAGASVVPQASMPHEAVRPGSQKETGATEKAQTTTPVKKEAKSKAGAVASEVEVKVGMVSTLVVETLVATVVPANGVAPIAAPINQNGEAAESDSRVVAPARSGLGSGIGKAVAGVSGHGGKERAQVGKRVFEASKDVGTAVSTAGEGVVGHARKDGSNPAKAPAAATSADEVRAQGASGSVAAPMVHSATGMPGHVTGDASPVKPHVDTVSSSVARVQEESRTVETAAPISEGHRTLMATPTTLEVGIANGTHGWLKVRAEMTSGGVVNASLSTASSTGQEMLHRELPSLTAYLQEERVGVNAVVLHASTGDSGSQQFSGAMDGNAGRGQMQQSQGQGGDGSSGTEAAAFSDRAEDAFYSEGLSGVTAAGWLAPAIYSGGAAGGWLSVRA
jgi:hypothetical protein